MNHSLENIFKAITPESIKNIPVIQDAMKIFVEVLEEKSKVSIDIKNVLNENSPQVIQDELVKIYLNDIYRVLNEVQHNKIIAEKIDRYNKEYGAEYIKKDVLGTLSRVLNEEHYFTTKEYKQKKGTVQGIKYIYDMIENIITTGEEKTDILIIEKEPFNLKIEGSMLKELYDNIVRPLAHPLGFVYTYVNIVKLYLEDNFNLIFHYYNSTVEVRCLYGNVDSYSHKTIIDVREEIISRRKVLKITFSDGSRLEQWNDPIVVKYFENDVIIKEYPEEGHCSIFLQYDFELELATKDEVTFRESKNLFDDFFDEEGQCVLIGNPNIIIGQVILGNTITIANELDDLIIGKFVIGRKRREIREKVLFRESQSIISNVDLKNTIIEDFDIDVFTTLSDLFYDGTNITDILDYKEIFNLDDSYIYKINDNLVTLDILEATKGTYSYQVYLEQGSYIINEFDVGELSEHRVGGSLVTFNTNTSEFYDVRQVKEDFNIELIEL